MTPRVTLLRCGASSSRRVQVVLAVDVEPGTAEQVAPALAAELTAQLADLAFARAVAEVVEAPLPAVPRDDLGREVAS